MRIGDSSREPLLPGRRNVRGNASSSKSGETGSASQAVGAQSGVAGSVVSELLGQLQSVPAIREELLADVELRLKSGELLTPQAADDTARQMLSFWAAYDD